jgi:hypothetical protein
MIILKRIKQIIGLFITLVCVAVVYLLPNREQKLDWLDEVLEPLNR